LIQINKNKPSWYLTEMEEYLLEIVEYEKNKDNKENVFISDEYKEILAFEHYKYINGPKITNRCTFSKKSIIEYSD
jgi:hypothetical protein